MYLIQQINSDLHNEINEIVDFVCSEFVSGSVLHHTLGVRLDEYTEYMRESIFSMIKEGFSYVAVDSGNNDICGCILAGDLTRTSADQAQIPQVLKPMKVLLDDLEQCYRNKRTVVEGSTVLVDVAVVSPRARGQGIYTQLRHAVHSIAREKGYSSVVGELSSVGTQYLCVEKLGHKILCEIEYETFEFANSYPFAGITQPPSIQLVEYQINEKKKENS